MFAAITGHAAFERRSGEQLVAQFLRISSAPVPDPREHGVLEDVSAIIEHAMSGDPGRRPSAAELGELLQASQRRHGFPVDEMALTPDPGVVQESTRSAPADSSSPEREPGGRWPAPTSDSVRTGGLPLELTSFVGRRTELAEAKNLLSTSRLVTLTGIGGVGKTRLAVRVATTAQRDFPDGVFLVELAELRDQSLLVDVVAGIVGSRAGPGRPPLGGLVEFLAPHTLLLVLDNCEQVVDAVATLAENVLQGCPEVRILTTSREPLGIGGEAVLQISPLPVPNPDHPASGLAHNDAVTLFAERGSVAAPGFVLTDDNTVTVARICRRLDGLPLPIE